MVEGSVGRKRPTRTWRRRRRHELRRTDRPAGLPVAEGFVLDLVAHVLVSDRGVVHLRPREYQLLETLASNPGRALSRSELVSMAWGRDVRVGPRSVDVHIHWLRS